MAERHKNHMVCKTPMFSGSVREQEFLKGLLPVPMGHYRSRSRRRLEMPVLYQTVFFLQQRGQSLNRFVFFLSVTPAARGSCVDCAKAIIYCTREYTNTKQVTGLLTSSRRLEDRRMSLAPTDSRD